jgi:hypothetical protein
MKHRYKDLMHVLHRPVELTANSGHWFYALLSGSTPSHKSIESDPIDLQYVDDNRLNSVLKLMFKGFITHGELFMEASFKKRYR